MTVSYAMLLAADPARWVDSAVAWRRLSRALDDHHDELSSGLTRQGQVWHGGTAAVAARESGAALVRRLGTAPPALLEVDQLLWRHAERIRLLQRRLAEALSAVRGTAVQVSADGHVSVVVPDIPRGGPPGLSGGQGSLPAAAGGARGSVPAARPAVRATSLLVRVVVGAAFRRGSPGGPGMRRAARRAWFRSASRLPGRPTWRWRCGSPPRSTRWCGRRGPATRTPPAA
ncbi:hypothetical protein ACFQZ4_21200 [Catellatospora coxensis]